MSSAAVPARGPRWRPDEGESALAEGGAVVHSSRGRSSWIPLEPGEAVWIEHARGIRAAGPTKLRTERCVLLGRSGRKEGTEARFGRYSIFALTRRRAIELLRELCAASGIEVI